MPSILFVCSANICRSPMAEGLFPHYVRNDAQEWRVGSAGVYAEPGFPAAWNTLLVLKRRGIDLSNHRSRPVTSDLLASYDLILTMERGHKEALRSAFPFFASKVWLISEMIGGKMDIVDPVGRSLVDYEDTAQEIEGIFSLGIEKIRRLVNSEFTQDDLP